MKFINIVQQTDFKFTTTICLYFIIFNIILTASRSINPASLSASSCSPQSLPFPQACSTDLWMCSASSCPCSRGVQAPPGRESRRSHHRISWLLVYFTQNLLQPFLHPSTSKKITISVTCLSHETSPCFLSYFPGFSIFNVFNYEFSLTISQRVHVTSSVAVVANLAQFFNEPSAAQGDVFHVIRMNSCLAESELGSTEHKNAHGNPVDHFPDTKTSRINRW